MQSIRIKIVKFIVFTLLEKQCNYVTVLIIDNEWIIVAIIFLLLMDNDYNYSYVFALIMLIAKNCT